MDSYYTHKFEQVKEIIDILEARIKQLETELAQAKRKLAELKDGS